MRRGISTKKELRSLSGTEQKKQTTSEELFNLDDDHLKNSTLKGGSIQALANHPKDLNKPPKAHHKPVHMARVGKTKLADGDGNAVRGTVAPPVKQNLNSSPLNYAGPEGIRFDDNGMVLPHSILGTLEDFRNYLEAKGETDGYRVGSEFWSLPQHYGDEMSGITATLTQTEQGRRKAVTYVGQPSSIQQESGFICPENLISGSRTWDRSAYLQQQCQELREVLNDMDMRKPDINGLEVIGSSKPFTFVTVCQSPSLEKEEEQHKEMKTENLDPLAQYEDVVSDALLIPALRFCGQLAKWTGNFPSNQGDVGINATIIFEAPTGDRASSHLELQNEGSTAIFYSWQQLPVPNSFPNLHSQTKSLHFYFNSSSDVILPGETQKVEFIFKSEEPGITTEIWQLNTHPVLLQGAPMQVTLKGVALYQDKTADQRLFVETKLEKVVTVKMCRAIVHEVLQGVHTPERPSTPVELYITKEEEFVSQNPKVLLSLPEQESIQNTITREKSLSQLNSLVLQLSETFEVKHVHLTVSTIGQQLWRKLLDTMDAEAMWLRNLLDLPGRETWIDKKDECFISDTDLTDTLNIDEKSERKGVTPATPERRGIKSTLKDNNKGESKLATTEKSVEESKKKGKKKEDVGKGKAKERQGKESASLSDTHPDLIIQQSPKDQNLEPAVINIYTRLLHKKAKRFASSRVGQDTDADIPIQGSPNTHCSALLSRLPDSSCREQGIFSSLNRRAGRRGCSVDKGRDEQWIKVREATSNDPWGPSSSLMSEIADLTFNVVAFAEVMGMVWKRLNDSGKNWRHVYKALTLLDYLLKTGSERVAQQCRENAFTIQTLRDFQYIDRDGRDQGANVREKARQLVCLLRDEERLRQERSQALKTKERMAGGGSGGGGGVYGGVPPSYHPGRRTSQPSMAVLYGEEFSRSRGSPCSFNSSSSSPRAASDLEQARPQTSGEEELQLQLALAMSREESQKVFVCVYAHCRGDNIDDVTMPPLQEQRCRQGDESLLQKALDESRRESQSGTRESAMLDLVDIFGTSSEPPASPTDPWNSAQPACDVTSDPWETVGNEIDPFTGQDEEKPKQEVLKVSSPQPASPTDVELFGVKPDSDPFATTDSKPDPFGTDPPVKPQVNGRESASPEMFDLSRLAPPLSAPPTRVCQTPEAFLGPTGASLVNLDALIPPNPPSKMHNNPFLSGLSVPSPNNPFHCDQPRLTLNQMRPSSTSPLPPHMLSYSPSLPLPLIHQPPILPSSYTQPPAGLLDLPSNLPQPLLPLSPRLNVWMKPHTLIVNQDSPGSLPLLLHRQKHECIPPPQDSKPVYFAEHLR
ncbi:Epsin-2 EPS-15-interacting protein 2 Intersectin-EH-binding protein 2 [Channa argus]|uniref:Epsin-2 EPS-15-interacting protein 2 Intersectin-EH-binding protein 2 n=1 Tax=Channa argus TaxID=215402 RepID=A0A6G1PAT1_CHAAH|nr:Epsin-2 EPS-15-interacting protein 2 Intersectin-EH-binding protein 2 [Channa argus]